MCRLSPGPLESRGVPARGPRLERLAGVLKTEAVSEVLLQPATRVGIFRRRF